MPFGDRFVLVLYLGLAQYLPAGREAALRIVDHAIARGRLSLAGLNDTSLLLLLALLPATSPHRPAVVSLVTARGLLQDSARVVQLLRGVAPPRLDDLVEIARPPVPPVRAMVLNALVTPGHAGVIEDVCLYLGRLHLLDPGGPQLRNLAAGLIAEATQRYARIPLGTVDYRGWAYRVVRWRTRSPQQPLPGVVPAGAAWFGALDAEERRFLDACLLHLPEPAVDLLYLHFYARLSVEQIVAALQLLQPQGAGDAVVRRIEECWDVVL